MADVAKFIVGGVFVAASFVLPAVGALGWAGMAGAGAISSTLLLAGTGLMQAALRPGAQGVAIDWQNTLDSQNPLPVLYGGAILPLRLVEPPRVDESSSDNKDLWIVGALCHGSENGQGIQQINEVWFDGILAVDSTGTVQAPFAGKLEFAKFLGTDAQNVASNTGYSTVGSSPGSTLTTTLNTLFPAAWPTTSHGAGVACVVLRLTYDQQVYGGIPNVTAAVAGNKVYDPRSAYARSNNAGWTYSPNPTLCIADYLLSARYGMKFATSEVDCGTAGSDSTSSVSLMAGFCEQLVTKPDSTTDWRFMCHGALDVAQAPTENLRRLLSSCRGAVFWEAGQARLAIRDVATPTSFALNEDVIVGDWNFRAPGVTDAPNIVRATYPDMVQNYRADTVQWPNPGASNSYLTADNGFESAADIELPMTVERWRAEQIALVTLKEMRSSLPVQVTCRETALQLRVGDVVPVTHSFPVWSAKPFWVTEIVFDPATALVRLSLVAYDANAYTLDAQTQYASPPATNLPDPTTIAAPTGVTLLSDSTTAARLPDGSMVNRIKVTWTPPGDPFLNHYLFYACAVGGSPTVYGPALAGDTIFYLGPVSADELWQVQMVAVNGLGRESALTTAVTVNTAVLGVQENNNRLVNGDGQRGLLTDSQVFGWSYEAGAHLLVVAGGFAGDRCLQITGSGGTTVDSSLQGFAVATGEVYHLSGWVRTTGALGGSGPGMYLQMLMTSGTATVLDAWGAGYIYSAANQVRVGLSATGSTTWQPVYATLRITASGNLNVYCIVGLSPNGNTGVAQWDDVRLTKQASALAIGGYKGNQSIDDGGSVFVPDTETVEVGTQTTPSVKTKPIRVAYTAFIPSGTGAGTVQYGLEDVRPVVLNTVLDLLAAVYLPKGITITNVSFEGYRQTTNDVVTLEMRKGSTPPGSSTQVYTASHASTGWVNVTHSAFSQLVGDEAYVFHLTIKAVSTLNDARFAWAEITYTMSDYSKGI